MAYTIPFAGKAPWGDLTGVAALARIFHLAGIDFIMHMENSGPGRPD